MESSSVYRQKARMTLKANGYGSIATSLLLYSIVTGILSSVVYGLVYGVTFVFMIGSPVILVFLSVLASVIIYILIASFRVGLYSCYLYTSRSKPFSVDSVFSFKDIQKRVHLCFMIGLYSYVWAVLISIPFYLLIGAELSGSILSIIVPIVTYVKFVFCYFIYVDHPEFSVKEILDYNKKLISGHKGDIFKVYLSFIGWGALWIIVFVVSSILLFIPAIVYSFWLLIYFCCTFAAIYNDLSNYEEVGAGDHAGGPIYKQPQYEFKDEDIF